MTKEALIEKLDLLPHPEGGYYRETYRSAARIPEEVLPAHTGARHVSTAIYFLLTSDSYSAFHRVRQDELWHFHQGDCIELHAISADGHYEKVLIGNDLERGAQPQCTVYGGTWFAACVEEGGSHALVSCTVAPGFDFQDFELADESLADCFPSHTGIIRRFLPAKS